MEFLAAAGGMQLAAGKADKLEMPKLFFVFIGCLLCSYGEESNASVPADVQSKINAIELRRRSAPDFKCSIPEVPGHTLGENPVCVGKPDYTLQRAGK